MKQTADKMIIEVYGKQFMNNHIIFNLTAMPTISTKPNSDVVKIVCGQRIT